MEGHFTKRNTTHISIYSPLRISSIKCFLNDPGFNLVMVIRGADEAGSRSEETRRRRTPTFATRPILRGLESSKLPRDRTDPMLSLLYQLWTGLLLDFPEVFCANNHLRYVSRPLFVDYLISCMRYAPGQQSAEFPWI